MKLCTAVRSCCALILLVPTLSFAETATVTASFDRWNYPFNASAGSRLSGSTFGTVADLAPAAIVPLNAAMTFDVDLSNPNVLGYVDSRTRIWWHVFLGRIDARIHAGKQRQHSFVLHGRRESA